MTAAFRVVSWNCRKATGKSRLWDHLMAMNPDVILLQEVSSTPEAIQRAFSTSLEPAPGKNDKPQRFITGYSGSTEP
jgi:hypothetical protein